MFILLPWTRQRRRFIAALEFISGISSALGEFVVLMTLLFCWFLDMGGGALLLLLCYDRGDRLYFNNV